MPFIEKFIKDMSDLIPEESDVLMKIPESFFVAKEKSGLEYDEFLSKVKEENYFNSDLEVFENWEKVKFKYLKTISE